MSLVLGFGACARLREPAALVARVREELVLMGEGYAAVPSGDR
jgi:hypothetical protein